MMKHMPPFTKEQLKWIEHGIGYWIIKEDCPEDMRKDIEKIFKEYNLKDTRGQNRKILLDD